MCTNISKTLVKQIKNIDYITDSYIYMLQNFVDIHIQIVFHNFTRVFNDEPEQANLLPLYLFAYKFMDVLA